MLSPIVIQFQNELIVILENYITQLKVKNVLLPIAIQFQNELIEKERSWEERFLSGTIVMADARFSCPQRKHKTASNCTNTVLNNRSGKGSEFCLFSSIICKSS